MERLAKDAKDWEGKLETLSQQVKAAEVQYESYDQKKEHLKEDIRRSGQAPGACGAGSVWSRGGSEQKSQRPNPHSPALGRGCRVIWHQRFS